MIKRINNRGSILIISYIVIIVLTILGGSLIMRSIAENRIALRYSGSNKALWLAEAGIQQGLWELNKNNCAGFTQCGTPTYCTDCACSNANKCLAGTLGTSGDYDVILDSGNANMSSTGSFPGRSAANRLQRGVEVGIGVNVDLTDYAAFVDAAIFMLTDYPVIDSYDSSQGPYGGSNIKQNAEVASNGFIDLPAFPQNVWMQDNSILKGNLSLGPNGEVVLDDSAQITGTITSNQPLVGLPVVEVPAELQSLFSGGNYTVVGGTQTLPAGDYKFSTLVVTKNGTLNINGDVRIYLTNTADSLLVGEQGGNSKINLSSGSSLTIYSDGRTHVRTGGSINAANDKNPAKFNLYSAVETPGGVFGLELSQSSQVYGIIHAPVTRVIVDSASNIYGSVIAKSLLLQASSGLHYDEALWGPAGKPVFGILYRINRWQEFQI